MRFDIKKRREELGLTLEEIGKFVGVSKGTVCKWERGFIRNMRRDKIIKLSEILQVSPIDFLTSEGYVAKNEIHKNVSLNEELKSKCRDFILSVFGIEVPDSAVIIFKDNQLILINSHTENAQNLLNSF